MSARRCDCLAGDPCEHPEPTAAEVEEIRNWVRANREPVTADVQRELAEVLAPLPLAYMSPQAVTAALLPTVQALIERAEHRGRAQGWANRSALAAEEVADAEKRAAAAALREAAAHDDAQPIRWPGASGQWLRAMAAALDPAGADSGEAAGA